VTYRWRGGLHIIPGFFTSVSSNHFLTELAEYVHHRLINCNSSLASPKPEISQNGYLQQVLRTQVPA